ncbi:MAG: hypothetical protein IPL45_09560 [Actinomycetales bacterium]|nr:hypothetical protein [Actinomycetales bacterium]
MSFEHARASYFHARALLALRTNRRTATAALHTAREGAQLLGARPLLQAVVTLAAQAHIEQQRPRPTDGSVDAASDVDPIAAGLTGREREVLSRLLAGDTYHQVATRLFISEKTVSSHVSNILRKTGGKSRVDLAAMVQGAKTRSAIRR